MANISEQEKLDALYRSGSINKEEFEMLKAEVLNMDENIIEAKGIEKNNQKEVNDITYDVILMHKGSDRNSVVQTLVNVLAVSRHEAKNLYDWVPSMLQEGISLNRAELIKLKMAEVGVRVRINLHAKEIELTEELSNRKIQGDSSIESEIAYLNREIKNLNNAITDAGGFLKLIFYNIIVQLAVVFIYYFIIGFIIGYADEIAKKDYQSYKSWFEWWLSTDSNGQNKLGLIKYLFDIVIFVTALNIINLIYKLSKSFGGIKRIK